jgi:hypothetical protein
VRSSCAWSAYAPGSPTPESKDANPTLAGQPSAPRRTECLAAADAVPFSSGQMAQPWDSLAKQDPIPTPRSTTWADKRTDERFS